MANTMLYGARRVSRAASGVQGRQTGRNEIRINKLSALCQSWQMLQSEGGFARAVGSGNQMANG